MIGRGLVAIGVVLLGVADPSIALSSSAVTVGDTIVVTLAGWPGTTTIAVCGNNAQRGQDCDQTGSVGLEGTAAGHDTRQLVITAPPVPCPCVVRASVADETVVKTVPLAIAGVPTALLVARSTAASDGLQVSTKLVHPHTSFVAKLRSWLGGRSQRQLRIRLSNNSSSPIDGVSVNAAVGRSAQDGSTLQPPNMDGLAPHRTRVVVIDATLSAPGYGAYRVFGTVYGPGAATTFVHATSITPWGLYLLVAVLIGDLIALLRLRARRRGTDQ